jgi:hypothetical protein
MAKYLLKLLGTSASKEATEYMREAPQDVDAREIMLDEFAEQIVSSHYATIFCEDGRLVWQAHHRPGARAVYRPALAGE